MPDLVPWRGERLREMREARGLSRRALSKASGLTEDTLYKLETGARTPAWDSLQALKAALGLATLDEFERPAEAGRQTRGPGRPRKEPAGPEAPKRPRGRPRKGE